MGIPGGPDDSTEIEDDPSTDVGMIRLLITDMESEPLFTDQQLAAILTAEGDNIKRAAASALSIIARSEVLLSKKISTHDLEVDGPAVAKELRASAAELRAEADAEDAATDSDQYGLDIVPLYQFDCPPPWSSSYL